MPDSAAAKIPKGLPWALGFLQAVGPISTDMYLPAFPSIEKTFSSPPGTVQLTLTTWMLGLALGQIIQGALADRFGRRLPLIWGTLLYTAGSAGCTLATGMNMLSTLRFITALGASASMVVPRAMVRDVTEGHAATKLMARLILILGVAPLLAPSLGALVLKFGDWRTIFWIATVYGAIAAFICLFLVKDTLPVAKRTRIEPMIQLRRYGRILVEPHFLTHALLLTSGAFALFAYLGGAPTVFINHFNISPARFAMVFGMVSLCFITASQINPKLIRRFGFDTVLTSSTWAYVTLVGLLLALAIAGTGGVVLFAGVLALSHGMNGFLAPCATVSALRHHADHAGSASALLGTMQFGLGATGGMLVGWLTNGTAVPMAGLMFCGAVAMKIADLYRPREVA